MVFEKFFDQAKAQANQMKSSVADGSLWAAFKAMGSERFNEFINQFNQLTPKLDAMGITLTALEIEVGIPPKFIPQFKLNRIPNAAEQAALKAEFKTDRILSLMLQAIFKAAELQSEIEIDSLTGFGLEVEITSIPTVRLLYR